MPAAKKAKAPTQLTDAEILAQLEKAKAEREREIKEARENLAKYGSVLAPTYAPPAPIPVPSAREGVTRIAPRAKVKIDPKWFKVLKTCPHCGEEKNVGKDFGIVKRRGLESANGWCRTCRNKVSYKNKPRKNETKTVK